MKEEEIEKILNTVRDILQIPFAGNSLKYKILLIKDDLARNIDFFRDPDDCEPPKKNQSLKGIRFELSRLGPNLWVPTIPDDRTCNVNHFVPDVIVNHIIDKDVKEGLIHMESGLRFPGLKERVFNLSYEKHNRFFYSGVIKETNASNCNVVYPENQADCFGSLCDYMEMLAKGENKANKIDVIKMLIYHLVDSDSFFKHVASEYFLRWKPLFDQQLLTKFKESV